jgi:flavin reductase (DIM6/NTAB) family NADH-FMN oxidoreductase RutF
MTLLYPKPTLLVGANVSGKPNFMTVAWGGIVNKTPPLLSVSIRRARDTFEGIEEVHVNEDCTTNGKPDVEKVLPLIFASGHEYAYFGLGEKLAPGFQVGKNLKINS